MEADGADRRGSRRGAPTTATVAAVAATAGAAAGRGGGGGGGGRTTRSHAALTEGISSASRLVRETVSSSASRDLRVFEGTRFHAGSPTSNSSSTQRPRLQQQHVMRRAGFDWRHRTHCHGGPDPPPPPPHSSLPLLPSLSLCPGGLPSAAAPEEGEGGAVCSNACSGPPRVSAGDGRGSASDAAAAAAASFSSSLCAAAMECRALRCCR